MLISSINVLSCSLTTHVGKLIVMCTSTRRNAIKAMRRNATPLTESVYSHSMQRAELVLYHFQRYSIILGKLVSLESSIVSVSSLKLAASSSELTETNG